MTISFFRTAKTLTIKGPKKNYTVKLSDERCNRLLAILTQNPIDENALYGLLDLKHKITQHVSGIEIDDDGKIHFEGIELPGAIGQRVLKGIKSDEPISHILKLWSNIMDNPDPRARSDLYSYLIHNQHPITPDGCFIAYRKVRTAGDGKLVDIHTGTFDNSVGQIVKMDREKCDSDPSITCSRGLHAASWDYVVNYCGNIIINIKVNPKDVVAIPVDYQERKLRCCEFYVIEINTTSQPMTGLTYHDGSGIIKKDEHAFEDIETPTSTSRELNSDDLPVVLTKIDPKENWKKQLRDTAGRFIKQKG